MTQNKFILPSALAMLCLASIVVLRQGQTTPSLPSQLPKYLAIKLNTNPETISQASTDYGHIVHVNASAVFEPTSVNDIIELIKYSNSIKKPFTIAARGQAHSADGQAMAHNGVVVNMTHLGDFRNGSGIIVSDTYVDVGGKGDLITCSAENNSEAFYAVLGGLGQYGIITRARITLGPTPSRVKWLRLLYTDFSAFSRDQEHLISLDDTNAADYVEGLIMLNKPPLQFSFFPASDKQRITSLVTEYGVVYALELVKYYSPNSETMVEKEVANLVKGLKFVPTFSFEKDVSYVEFLDRVHTDELVLRSKGLWEVPHPWINLFVPKSRILDFNKGVIKGIILKQNISAEVFLIYAMNRNK
ncbi:unnamed protein product [Lupinus luteus]|uniref:Cytokinin dehydrogenase 1 FAD/cytokinin binding domain-containing protein n=1 Tax=Lupinus luteus TaxID=3873 RepID=A0AAV1W681_LUPLU